MAAGRFCTPSPLSSRAVRLLPAGRGAATPAAMRTLLVIGIGAGDPDYVTLQAVAALNRADVFFIPDKGAEKAALKALRETIIAHHVTGAPRLVGFDVPERRLGGADYTQDIGAWRAAVEAVHARLIDDELRDGETGAFLIWGDPAIYDGTLRILAELRARGADIAVEAIPGISAPQALAARHGIALNGTGEPIHFTTGRRLADALPDAENIVVMLDSNNAFASLADPAAFDIYWGAYLGMPDEILIAGRLSDVAAEIVQRRAAARAQHGWIMDTYLLRRCRP